MRIETLEERVAELEAEWSKLVEATNATVEEKVVDALEHLRWEQGAL